MNDETQSAQGPVHQVVGQLRELLSKATPGPWVGDRFDGTVKYCILGGQNRVPVCRGDNGNSEHGPYGFDKWEDETLVMAMRNALPTLLAIAEAAEQVQDGMDKRDEDEAEWAAAGTRVSAMEMHDRRMRLARALAAAQHWCWAAPPAAYHPIVPQRGEQGADGGKEGGR